MTSAPPESGQAAPAVTIHADGTSAEPLRVVITGASSGLGEAFAREYAQRHPGVRLLLIARRADRLADLVRQLGSRAHCDPAVLDVTDTAALRTACRTFVERHGPPDVVIANAGISAGTSTGIAGNGATFRRIMDVNLHALRETFDAVIGPMQQAGAGTLVGIASVAGVRGLPGSEAYSASKAAAIAYLESLRTGLRGSGVAVVTIAPGFVRTEMTAVNRFRMPFLIDADVFARSAVDAIERRRRFVVIPWPMALVARVLRVLPAALYDALVARAPRKSRQAGTPQGAPDA